MKRALELAAVVAAFLAQPAAAAVVPAEWISTGAGSLNGVDFSVSGVVGVQAVHDDADFTDPGHAFAPLIDVDSLEYGATSDLSIDFDDAIDGLILYADSWRGVFLGNSDDPAVTYTFNTSFEVLSGFTQSLVTATTITIDDPADGNLFEDGVIRFLSPVTTLTIDSEGALGGSGQALTFAVEIPAPGAFGLLAITLGAAAALRRRWRR